MAYKRGGMKNPAYFLKKEFPGYYNRNNQPSRDEFTKEELAAIKARIDEQVEAERSKLQAWITQKEQEEAVALANIGSWF